MTGNRRRRIADELDNIGRVPRAAEIPLRDAISSLEAVAAAWPNAAVNVNHIRRILDDLDWDLTYIEATRRN